MGVWSARTLRSGSATVTRTPIIKHIGRISQTFLSLTSLAPISSPMIIIEVSAPSVKSPMPTTRRTVPTKNIKNISPLTGTIEIIKRKTIAATGRTEPNDSFIFSKRFFFTSSPLDIQSDIYHIISYFKITGKIHNLSLLCFRKHILYHIKWVKRWTYKAKKILSLYGVYDIITVDNTKIYRQECFYEKNRFFYKPVFYFKNSSV